MHPLEVPPAPLSHSLLCRYNVGCTKRVGLFHPDRSKLQKPGGPPHGRRRTCKVPTLSKDTKKQVRRGWA